MADEPEDLKLNFSFSGCGFLCIYHAGVAAAIKEYAPKLVEDNTICGASAGAIVAAGLLTNVCISDATSTILKIVREARTKSLGVLSPTFDLMSLVRTELQRYLPEDAYKRCNGKLKISVTRWIDKQNVIIDQYDSNDELIDAITCSCFIPGVCGVILPEYRGVKYLDGGFSDNLPTADAFTVTVSPFSGESDICPPDSESSSFFGMEYSRTSIRFTTMNLFRLIAVLMPPSLEDCTKMCLQGFSDALRFLTKYVPGFTPCIRCLTVNTTRENAGSQASTSSLSRSTPPPRFRTLSATQYRNVYSRIYRRQVVSECDACGDVGDIFFDDGTAELAFPSMVQRTFDEARDAEHSVFKWFLSFWVIKCTRMAFGIWKYPLDIMLIMAKRLTVYLKNNVCPEWLVIKLTAISNFINTEIDKHMSLATQYYCQLPFVSYLTFPALKPPVQKPRGPPTTLATAEMKYRERRIASSRIRRMQKAAKRDCIHEKEQIEPSTSRIPSISAPPPISRPQSLDMDRSEGINVSIEKASKTPQLHSLPPVGSAQQGHSKMHGAFYSFHYLDENNKMRNIELFDMEHSQAHVHRHISSPVPEEVCEDGQREGSKRGGDAAGNSGSVNEDEDSGLSCEDNANNVMMRDACCSPVLQLSGRRGRSAPPRPACTPQSPPPVRNNGVISLRRRTYSTDSEDESNFFVPCGRRRSRPMSLRRSRDVAPKEPESSKNNDDN